MINHELDQKFARLVREERRITNEILQMINHFEQTRGYLHLAYSSLFDWLTRGHGYSESAAYRRIEGARLIKAVPEAAQKLQTGQVSLTQLAKIQSVVRAQEKATRKKVSSVQKANAIAAIEGKAKLDGEQNLLQMFPAANLAVNLERKTVINDSTVRLSLNISTDGLRDLNRAKDILSHALPGANYADVITRILREFLTRQDRALGSFRRVRSLAQD